MMMLHLIPPALMMCLGEVIGQPGGYGLTERAYVYLEKQDLIMLASVFSVLLVLMIIMAVCVYKPLTRR